MVRERNLHQVPWGRAAVAGGIAGLVAGLVMAMFFMIASATYLDMGLFTPVYAIAATFTDGSAMQASMGANGVYWETGPALLGTVIHMMTSIALGVIFGLLTATFRATGLAAFVWGLIYGLAVLAVMTFAVIPLAGAVDMASALGWTTWTIGHLVFGGILGLWPALRARDVAASPERDRAVEYRRAA